MVFAILPDLKVLTEAIVCFGFLRFFKTVPKGRQKASRGLTVAAIHVYVLKI